MPGQRTKFSEVWLTAKDCNGDTVSDWCKKGKDDFHGYCCVYKIDLKCDNGGKVQLLKHCSNQKHQEAMQRTKDTKQTKLIFSSKAEATPSTSRQGNLGSLTTTADGALEAEIFWLAKMACYNFSLRSSDHIGDLFQAMFPDSKVAKAFSMSRTEASYTVGDCLGPHFAQTIVDDLTKSELPFSVHFDETTTSQVKRLFDSVIQLLVCQNSLRFLQR